MAIRIAAVGVSHWHALNDAAYLRHLLAMPDVELVAIQDSDAEILAKRAAAVGNPPTYADYGKMLAATRPDFVLALGRHRQMAAIAHDLLDAGYPFLMGLCCKTRLLFAAGPDLSIGQLVTFSAETV